jgi:benzoyl-CoA reductase/2-hydroxyglutaryl-CoA dehydratase subunit BcrC/BadD/HgdB
MARKKGKSVSFDAMVKFFMQYYNIPTRKDIDKLTIKIDNLEKLIKKSMTTGKGKWITARKTVMTSSNMVLDVIKPFRKGVGFAQIQERTGFEEKKLRNIIFRLHKMGKIVRKSRGIYIIS